MAYLIPQLNWKQNYVLKWFSLWWKSKLKSDEMLVLPLVQQWSCCLFFSQVPVLWEMQPVTTMTQWATRWTAQTPPARWATTSQSARKEAASMAWWTTSRLRKKANVTGLEFKNSYTGVTFWISMRFDGDIMGALLLRRQALQWPGMTGCTVNWIAQVG